MTILPAVALLGGAGDHAGLDEVDDGVGEHLGVDPEVVLVRSARGPSRPGWRRCRAGASRRPARGRRRGRRSAARRRRSTGTACSYGGTSTSTPRSMSSTWTKLSPSVRGIDRLSWTMTVFAARIAACIASTLVPSEQNPWASGGVALTNTTSSGSAPDLEQPRHVGQEHRHVVGPPLVDRGARVRPDEQRAMPEMALHPGREVRPRALGVQVDDADVVQLRGPVDQRLEQDRRRGGRAMEVDAVAGSDDGGGLGRRHDAHGRHGALSWAETARAGRTRPW